MLFKAKKLEYVESLSNWLISLDFDNDSTKSLILHKFRNSNEILSRSLVESAFYVKMVLIEKYLSDHELAIYPINSHILSEFNDKPNWNSNRFYTHHLERLDAFVLYHAPDALGVAKDSSFASVKRALHVTKSEFLSVCDLVASEFIARKCDRALVWVPTELTADSMKDVLIKRVSELDLSIGNENKYNDPNSSDFYHTIELFDDNDEKLLLLYAPAFSDGGLSAISFIKQNWGFFQCHNYLVISCGEFNSKAKREAYYNSVRVIHISELEQLTN